MWNMTLRSLLVALSVAFSVAWVPAGIGARHSSKLFGSIAPKGKY